MKTITIALSFLLLVRTAVAQDKAELRRKWPHGYRFVYRMEKTYISLVQQSGRPSIPHQELSMAVEFAIGALKEREGGGREMDLEFLWQRMEMKLDGTVVVDFDSSSPKPNIPASAAVIGKKLKIIAKSDGSIESIAGMGALDSAPPKTGEDRSSEMLKGLLGWENLDDIGFGNEIPEKQVKAGDVWASQIDLLVGPWRTFGLKSKATFAGLEKHGGVNCARLETALTVPTGTEIPSTAPNTKIPVESIRVTRTTWFDLGRGQILDSTMRQEFTLKIPDSPGPDKGRIRFTIPAVQNTTLKLIEIR